MPDRTRFSYRAFISYSHRDKAWADWLHKALETYSVPSRLVGTTTAHGTIPHRLNPVFRDRDELASATDLGRKVNEALAQSENLVVICSPASAASRWVNEEVLAYKRMGRASRIFCLIVDGEPNATDLPGREAEECFCPALRFATGADGRPTDERTEPIAADVRPGKDGKQNAKLKLIAGMLDVGFDALKQREQRRQVQRMTAIAALAVIVMLITSALAVAAQVSRHRAIVAQHEAVIAKQVAVRRQKQAEDLVDFMLGDLNNKLWQVGRLDIMKSVNDKAMAYFKSLPPTDVNDNALVLRAKALEKIGGVRLQSGSDADAIDAFRASARISSRLAAAAPSDLARQIAYSRTLTFIGDTYNEEEDFADAQPNLELAKRLLQPFLKRASNVPSLLVQLVYVDDNLGQVMQNRGQLEAAETDYRDMLLLARTLAASRPDNANAQALGKAHDLLAGLALQRGDLAGAVRESSAAVVVAERALARDPKDNDQRHFALDTRAVLGHALVLVGDERSGTRDLQQAADTATRLLQADPNDDWSRSGAAIYSSELAGLQRANGHLAAAEALSAKAVTIMAAETKRDSTDNNDYADILVERALDLQAAGKHAAADAAARNALGVLQTLIAANPHSLDAEQAAMRARLLLATANPDPARATALREEALRALQSAPVTHDDLDSMALEIQALLALDRKADAQPLIRRLWNGGYRDPEFVALMQREHIAYPVNRGFQARLAAATHAVDGGVVPVPAVTDTEHK
ncbi:MAG: hypothetical protein OJF61_002067 [Rhodanobacteraceae bacterium]|jgi:tetratricopeptide (TPR) repeat protein|nr:MAG: hypothetical protein OJF61_002067 [Rhodanobacteraceae bacterium]